MPIKILIHGTGSYPQIHVLLPRYKALYVKPEVAFKAITKLCYTWKSPFEIDEESSYDVFQMTKHELEYLYRNDWFIISIMVITNIVMTLNLIYTRNKIIMHKLDT